MCLYLLLIVDNGSNVLSHGNVLAHFMQEATKSDPLLDRKHITLEFASFSDGKEAVAKAANYLFTKNYSSGDQKELSFTESHMDEALKAVGVFFLFSHILHFLPDSLITLNIKFYLFHKYISVYADRYS